MSSGLHCGPNGNGTLEQDKQKGRKHMSPNNHITLRTQNHLSKIRVDAGVHEGLVQSGRTESGPVDDVSAASSLRCEADCCRLCKRGARLLQKSEKQMLKPAISIYQTLKVSKPKCSTHRTSRIAGLDSRARVQSLLGFNVVCNVWNYYLSFGRS